MTARRSAWTPDRNVAYLSDPYYVADMPSNEERLAHLDFYTRAKDGAPTIAGGKRGGEGFGKYDDEPWVEEHEVCTEYYGQQKEGIRKVGI